MFYVEKGGAELASQLKATKEPFVVVEMGETMWRYHPTIGLHVANIDELGNVVLTEHQLGSILETSQSKEEVAEKIDDALGKRWDTLLNIGEEDCVEQLLLDLEVAEC